MANGVTVVVVILLTYSVIGSLPVRLSPLKTRFDFLIVTPTEPKELGYVHSYVSKPLGGYLEIVVTPLTGTLTNMELTGAQKLTRETDYDFIGLTTRVKAKDEFEITPNCTTTNCSYTLRISQRRNFAMPMLYKLMESVPQCDSIGEDTLFTGITYKFYQVIALPGSDPLVIKATPYNGKISISVFKCGGISYAECVHDEYGIIHTEANTDKDNFYDMTAPVEHKVRGRPRVRVRPRNGTTAHVKNPLITIPRHDDDECSYIIRVVAKKDIKYKPVITRYRLMYWWNSEG
jgi:hypothetical protein